MSDQPRRRAIPTVELGDCPVCGRPVELYRVGRSIGLFEPEVNGAEPHICPSSAVERWRRMVHFARLGDPKALQKTRLFRSKTSDSN